MNILKNIFDRCLSFILLIVLSPLYIIIIILIKLIIGSPVIFKQRRPGKNEKIFTMYKFRTMTEKKDASGDLLPDKDRLTVFGHILRKTSLDELPELINILKGDMSFVGPRPLLVEYLPLYNEEQKQRHLVKPGLTGWAQINGRNAISWEQKFKFDIFYIQNRTFWLDIKILFSTLIKVFKREGITSENSETMEIFKGK